MGAKQARKSKPRMALSRRRFLQVGAAACLGAFAGAGRAFSAPAVRRQRPPNILLIITDQQGLDTISACGCPYLRTPAMDELVRGGTWFAQSHSANPLCSPARSSIFTGRITSETGVVRNGLPIREDMPNLAQWLGEHGYEAVYSGKWHLPRSYTVNIPGFRVLCSGLHGLGNLCDSAVSRACEAYLYERERSRPFFLVASFLQPHDICQWVTMHAEGPAKLPYPEIADELPPLPENFNYDPREPRPVRLRHERAPRWSEEQWRYYLWSYYRHVEMVDAEVGRVLQALEATGQRENTLVIFTADHGEGRARHQMVLKNYLYDEAVKVPLVISWPGELPEGKVDREHLVSGLDIVPTVCELVGVNPPPKMRGRSLVPLLQGRNVAWREFVIAEVERTGRMVRTPGFKYITYYGDETEQLFDMERDPGETKNVAGEARYAAALAEHRKLLREWESKLELAPGVKPPEALARGG